MALDSVAMKKSTSNGRREDFVSSEGPVATLRDGVSTVASSIGSGITPGDRIGAIGNHSNVECAEEQTGQFDDASVEEDGNPAIPPAAIPNNATGDKTKAPPTLRLNASIADEPSSAYPPEYGKPLALNVSIPTVARMPVPVPVAIAPRIASAASLVGHPFPIHTTTTTAGTPLTRSEPAPARIESSDNDITMTAKRVYADDIGSSDVLCGR